MLGGYRRVDKVILIDYDMFEYGLELECKYDVTFTMKSLRLEADPSGESHYSVDYQN